jgi:hypothetical protein
VEGLGFGDDVGTLVRQTRLMRHTVAELDVGRVGMVREFALGHLVTGFARSAAPIRSSSIRFRRWRFRGATALRRVRAERCRPALEAVGGTAGFLAEEIPEGCHVPPGADASIFSLVNVME